MIEFNQVHGMALVIGPVRKGCRQYGVPNGGAMNAPSFDRLNAALGNSPEAAGIEMTGRFRIRIHKAISVMVGPAAARYNVDQQPYSGGRLLDLQEGQTLEILPPSQGLWTQLAVRGGLDLPIALGSQGTCLAGQFGGLAGRLIESGDMLHTGSISGLSSPVSPVALPALDLTDQAVVQVKAVAGPEFDQVFRDPAGHKHHWSLDLKSNRMGYRFLGDGNLAQNIPNLPSYACTSGLIQITPDGNAIVLMADAQVTGGYPRAGYVLATELWKVALLTPGQRLEFEWVSSSSASHYNEKFKAQWLRFLAALTEQRGRQTK